ncbi:MAG: ABC transporter substrate-binding protein [Alphaproteobacteria bacterium]|nr:ABC transporter substrate-binding protein [Alphaproteobacteria bacterium]
MTIRLMENFRAAFYAPYYATHALGFYAREGVEVELMSSDAPGDAVPKLLDGTIDLTWGGPMRVLKAHDADPRSQLVNFCEVVARDPFFLIGRAPAGPFVLSDLPQMRFASVSEVPTPWLCLQHDLREHGIDPDRLQRISDRSMARNYDALRAGEIDVMQAFEPFATLAERDRAGDVLYTASARGPTVYTAFIATREAAAERHGEFAAVARANSRMLRWLYSNPPEELATAVASFFPDIPGDVLAGSLRRYRDAGLWAREPTMSQIGFERLAQSLHSGGFIARVASYDECVEASLNGINPGS